MTADTLFTLLNSNQVSNKTREVLQQRLTEVLPKSIFFTAEEFDLLQAVCDCLLAQTEPRIVDIAGIIDQRLLAKSGTGWRYDVLPEDGIAYKTGLKGIAETVLLLHHKTFADLSAEEKKYLLKTVQQGNAFGEIWKDFPGERFFELLLTEATEHFYSHPSVQAEINYTGFVDAQGWQVPQL